MSSYSLSYEKIRKFKLIFLLFNNTSLTSTGLVGLLSTFFIVCFNYPPLGTEEWRFLYKKITLI